MQRRTLLAAMGASALAGGLMPRAGLAAAPLDVVATTGMIADLATRVGGDLVSVRGLMGPGVDPHSYRQTRTDIVAMTKADLVLWHGLYLEAQMEEFFHKLESRGNVLAVADALPRDLLLSHPDYADKFDPHVWMVPEIWAQVVPVVREALAGVLPGQEAALEANAEALEADIAQLDTYARDVLATVPEQSRVLVTAHDAFSYFGRAYGFEVLGIQGISTESEAGLNRIGELVDVLVEREVAAVFGESSVSDRNIRALIEGAAARGHEVRIGGELFSDAMGQPDSYEGTYIGMIDHNVTVIASALGGTAPGRGMNGKLSAGI
ncbi:metal ABC transporter solute-binding protein, Zn/Mn family [Tropicimonas sediminicola]|uniref:Manganese/zinc/iron transport system substrate-binding protein n=1 Tax=Tropicimonas sediminicola TaxID=1031541 RepID=A0A239GN94_9RHOB|nr:zinc ABC transporter substrate-binding protein [Tropicimonas sediminicola]SNS69973.1 manganese/zinc/iron transport system substrate-binding protein [Tropicimonas sediminicola]